MSATWVSSSQAYATRWMRFPSGTTLAAPIAYSMRQAQRRKRCLAVDIFRLFRERFDTVTRLNRLPERPEWSNEHGT